MESYIMYITFTLVAIAIGNILHFACVAARTPDVTTDSETIIPFQQ